jgi:hypothetical protein
MFLLLIQHQTSPFPFFIVTGQFTRRTRGEYEGNAKVAKDANGGLTAA